MTLVFLNPVGTLGGGERSLIDLTTALRDARPNLRSHLILGTAGPLEAEAARLGLSCEVVAMPAALNSLGESRLHWSRRNRALRFGSLAMGGSQAAFVLPAYLRRLRTAIERRSPTLIHSNGLKCHLTAGYALPRAASNIPVVWHMRDFLGARPLLGRWLRRLARGPSLAIANSQAVADDVRIALPGVPVETVYNGVDTDFFSPAEAVAERLDELAQLPTAPQGILRVGIVATYARWKGQDIFIDAAAKLAERGRADCRFYVIGGPTYVTVGSQFTSAELRQQIGDRRLVDCCGLVPFQTDLRSIYRGLDVVVHASTRPEPFGRTIVEAMSCGRAVVAAHAGGVGEIVTGDRDALLTPPGDADALAEAIERLLDDRALRGQLGAQARRTAVERFGRAAMADRVLRLYAGLGVDVG